MLGRQAKSVPGSLVFFRLIVWVFFVALIVGYATNRAKAVPDDKSDAEAAKAAAKAEGVTYAAVESSVNAAKATVDNVGQDDKKGVAEARWAEVGPTVYELDYWLWWDCYSRMGDAFNFVYVAGSTWEPAMIEYRDNAVADMASGDTKFGNGDFLGAKAKYNNAKNEYLRAQGEGNFAVQYYNDGGAAYDEVVYWLRFW